MRFYLGAPIAHHLWSGVSVGRYAHHHVVPVVYHQPARPSTVAGVLVVLVVLAIAIEFWPVTLVALAVALGAFIVHQRSMARERLRTAELADELHVPPQALSICW